MKSFDALIVGGGPSGAICASYLAKAGLKVAIMEQASFPRYQIGESLLPWTRQVFEEIGFDAVCRQEGLIVKRGAIFHSERTGASKNFDFSESLNPTFATAYTVDRRQFDELLLRHAESLGATILQPCRFESADRSDAGYVVQSSQGQFATDLLIMAAGTATKSLFPSRYLPNRPSENRSAVIGYFPAPKDGPYHHLFGNISINLFYLDAGQRQPYWSWATPVSQDEISLGFVLPTADWQTLKAEHKSDGEVLGRLLTASPFQRQFIGAPASSPKPLRPVQYRVNFQRIPTSIVGDHLLFVGDAAGFIDPVFSSGVHLGAVSAKLAAKEVLALRAAGLAPEQRNLLRYQNSYLYHFWLYYRFVAAFYQKNIVEKLFLSASYDDAETTQKQREFSSLLAGDSQSENALFAMIQRARVAIDPAIEALIASHKNHDIQPKGNDHDRSRYA